MKFKKLLLLSSLSGVSLLPLISMSCSKQDESKTDQNKPNTSEVANPSDDKDKDNTSTTPSTDNKDTNTSAATDNKTDKPNDMASPAGDNKEDKAPMMEHKANAKYSLSIKASKNDKVVIALNFKDNSNNPALEANKYALSIKVSDKELESQNEIIIEREVVGKASQQPNEVVFELDITRKDKPYQRQEVSVFGLKYNNALVDNDKIEIEF